MSKMPSTRREMIRAGYNQTGRSQCKRCGAPIEWWNTTNGKNMPFDPIEGDDVETTVHWATCPNSAEFRGETKAAPTKAHEAPAKQRNRHEQWGGEAIRLLERSGASAVVIAWDDEQVFAYKKTAGAEDTRNSLIAAANGVRRELLAERGRQAIDAQQQTRGGGR